MIFKAISKTGSLGSCFVCMDIGAANGWLCKIFRFDTAETRIILKWLFPPRFSDKIGLPPAFRMLYWLRQSTRKQKSNRLAMKWGQFFGVGGGN
jgi:hypothetical protein